MTWLFVFVFFNGQEKYKFKAKELLKSGCNELRRPDILNAMYNSSMWSKVTICPMAVLLDSQELNLINSSL